MHTRDRTSWSFLAEPSYAIVPGSRCQAISTLWTPHLWQRAVGLTSVAQTSLPSTPWLISHQTDFLHRVAPGKVDFTTAAKRTLCSFSIAPGSQRFASLTWFDFCRPILTLVPAARRMGCSDWPVLQLQNHRMGVAVLQVIIPGQRTG